MKEAFALGGSLEKEKINPNKEYPDHAGELRLFDHVQVYISHIEADAMNINGKNIIKVDFTEGQYKNFAESQIISEKQIVVLSLQEFINQFIILRLKMLLLRKG